MLDKPIQDAELLAMLAPVGLIAAKRMVEALDAMTGGEADHAVRLAAAQAIIERIFGRRQERS